MTTIKKIALDLDGVFADFHGKYRQLNLNTSSDLSRKEKSDQWNYFLDHGGFTDIPYLDDGHLLLTKIAELKKQHNLKVYVLTSAGGRGQVERITHMKKQWVMNYQQLFDLLDGETDIHVVAQASLKQDYADGNTLLIDDSSRNIVQFNEAGGNTIKHISAADTIVQLNQYFS